MSSGRLVTKLTQHIRISRSLREALQYDAPIYMIPFTMAQATGIDSCMASMAATSAPPAYEHHQAEDDLPHYSCSINLTGTFLLKQELNTPSQVTRRRGWRRAQAELRGTALIITTPTRYRVSAVSRSYSLQAADAGIAADYKYRSYVLRVRAEGEQFLLAATSLLTIINWVEKLNAAISISPDLDARGIPDFCFRPAKEIQDKADFVATFYRRYKEDWLQSKSERQWLAQPQRYPEVQLPYLAPELPVTSASVHLVPRSSHIQDGAELEPSLAVPQQYLVSYRYVALLGEIPSHSPGISTVRDPHSLILISRTGEPRVFSSRSFVLPPEQTKLVTASSRFKANLDHARRCTRVLLYDSPWKND